MTAVIFYSNTGNTRSFGERLAKEFDGRTIEIKDTKNRASQLSDAIATVLHQQTTVEPSIIDVSSFNTLFVGSPVWLADMTPAARTFLASIHYDGKRVIPFVCATTCGFDSALDKMQDIIKQHGGKVVASTYRLDRGTEKELQIRLEELKTKLNIQSREISAPNLPPKIRNRKICNNILTIFLVFLLVVGLLLSYLFVY